VHLPDEVHRASLGVEAGLRDLHAAGGGLGFKQSTTEGHSIEDWNRIVFDKSDLPRYVTYEDFKKKGYFVLPCRPDDEEP